MKKQQIWLLVLALAAAWAQWLLPQKSSTSASNPPAVQQQAQSSEAFERVLQQAYREHRSNLQIQGSGTVAKILPDDNKGTRHQKFLLRLGTGQTLLVAHNIDLAPRLDGLQTGGTVAFNGEYEWNPQGGVIHWTHRDPSGKHPGGWLKYQLQTVQ